MSRTALAPAMSLAPLLLLAGYAFAADEDDDDAPSAAPPVGARPSMDFEMLDVVAPSRMMAPAAELSATVGGAQDIAYFRDGVANGQIPHPKTFTPEGLFSEHDLPVPDGGPCVTLLCPVGAATTAELLVQPEVRYLAQLGFHTGIDASAFRRAPLNLVAVVDKSGSMSGQPIDMVRASLHTIAAQLGPDDQLSLVLYGATVHVWMPPTPGNNRGAIDRAIDGIRIDGSTNMEAGLAEGYGLAEHTRAAFDGVTRVMLFTDERPNVGRTDATSFMGMAEAASLHGVGLTTIGVGEQFGAELATKISSVRGGNLFFFPDSMKMNDVFHEEFETMVTELAYDMDLRVKPAPGLRIAGVYGIPGDAVEWEGDTLHLHVATLFPSKQEGGIYFAFAPDGVRPGAVARPGQPVANVALDYTLRSGRIETSSMDFPLVSPQRAPLGLVRGGLLVEEATVLREATALHHERNDQEGAWQLVRQLQGELLANHDAELDSERLTVGQLEATLAQLSGHQGEAPRLSATRDPISGLPHR